MARVTMTAAAIHNLAADPKLRKWKNEKAGSKVPILGYYRRSYLTANDGTVTEYGDGFMLTFDRKNSDWKQQGLQNEEIKIDTDINIFVIGPKQIFDENFTIDWKNYKYTFEPSAGRPMSV